MKLQLDENTFNAYLNEAINEELGEGIGTKVGQGLANMGQKILNRAAKKSAPRVVGHAPRTKSPFKFSANAKNAKNARLSLRSFRKGQPLEMSVQGSHNPAFNGKKFWVKKVDGKVRFFSDPSCKEEYLLTTEKGGFGAAARSSWNSELSHMKNILNSARRNMAGTALAGTAAGLGINAMSHKNDPWNADQGEGAEGGNGQGEGGNNGWDGTFPWDNIEPRWTPRQPRKAAPVQNQQPAQAQRQEMEQLPAVNTNINVSREAQAYMQGQEATRQANNQAATDKAMAQQLQQSQQQGQQKKKGWDVSLVGPEGQPGLWLNQNK